MARIRESDRANPAAEGGGGQCERPMVSGRLNPRSAARCQAGSRRSSALRTHPMPPKGAQKTACPFLWSKISPARSAPAPARGCPAPGRRLPRHAESCSITSSEISKFAVTVWMSSSSSSASMSFRSFCASSRPSSVVVVGRQTSLVLSLFRRAWPRARWTHRPDRCPHTRSHARPHRFPHPPRPPRLAAIITVSASPASAG